MNTIEQVREFFLGDVFATRQGIVIDSIDEGAVCSVALEHNHTNAMGSVQGGLIYTLADFAFAVATNKHDLNTVTLNSSISYFAQPKGNRLIATARCAHSSGRTCVYDIDITDELGTAVAACRATGYRIGKGNNKSSFALK